MLGQVQSTHCRGPQQSRHVGAVARGRSAGVYGVFGWVGKEAKGGDCLAKRPHFTSNEAGIE